MIIGITGKKRSGKTTIAEYLEKEYDFTHLAFADAVREVCSTLHPDLDFWDDSLKEVPHGRFGLTPRSIMQKIGTDVMRNHYNPDIWLSIVETYIANYSEVGENIIVSDCRFDNEINMIRNYEGEIWRIERPDLISEDQHESENGITLEPDKVISNTTSISGLYLVVDEIMRENDIIKI